MSRFALERSLDAAADLTICAASASNRLLPTRSALLAHRTPPPSA